MRKFLILGMSLILASCGAGEASQAEFRSYGNKVEAFQISDLGAGPFITLRDIGTRPGDAHYVEMEFELQNYAADADAAKTGHIAVGIGNVYKPGSNDWQAPYGEGFILGQTQIYPEVAGRCVRDNAVVNGVAFIRESYYSRSVLDGAACFGPLKQNQRYRAYMELDEKQQTRYRLYEDNTLLAQFSGSWVEVRQFDRIGFFVIPLPDTGRYKLYSLKVGTFKK